MTLTIVGLGPGAIDDLTRRAWHTLENATTVYLRTRRHPCVPDLPPQPTYHDFDHVYEKTTAFPDVYATIIDQVLAAAQGADIVYAVPGDPLVAESTVTGILQRAPEMRVSVEVISGVSFIEPMLRLLEIDALDGLQLIDALTVGLQYHPPINPDYPALLAQVYSRAVASNVKLTLMNEYPDDFIVTLVHAAGTAAASLERVPLFEIDRSERIDHLTSLYLPARGGLSSFESFQNVIAHLRSDEGCPWDRKQTHESLRRYLLEETHEVLEAIDAGDIEALSEELGDVLLQVVLHTQIAIDNGDFRMGDVLRKINHKMIERHPHVFAKEQVADAEEVVTNWEAINQRERAEQGRVRDSLLDGVPKGMAALYQAHEYQRKAAKVGFDWTQIDDVFAKVREELDEIAQAESDEHRAEEMGDLLFALVNWARWLKIEPETALRQANAKFYRRFRYIEQALAAQGRSAEDSNLAEMDALWDAAKAEGL